jgi:hypothetical protein
MVIQNVSADPPWTFPWYCCDVWMYECIHQIRVHFCCTHAIGQFMYCDVTHYDAILFTNICNIPAAKWRHLRKWGKMLMEMPSSVPIRYLSRANIHQDIFAEKVNKSYFCLHICLADSVRLILKDISADISMCKFLCCWQCHLAWHLPILAEL